MKYGTNAWQGHEAPAARPELTEDRAQMVGRVAALVRVRFRARPDLRREALRGLAARILDALGSRTPLNVVLAKLSNAVAVVFPLPVFRPAPLASAVRPAARPASPNAPNAARWATPAA